MGEKRKDAVTRLVRRSLFTAVIFTAALSALAFLFGKSEMLISISAGAFMAMASFVVLVAVVMRAIPVECASGEIRPRPVAFVATVGCLKLALLGAALWFLISRNYISPLPFMAGFSTMVAALLVEGWRVNKTGS